MGFKERFRFCTVCPFGEAGAPKTVVLWNGMELRKIESYRPDFWARYQYLRPCLFKGKKVKKRLECLAIIYAQTYVSNYGSIIHVRFRIRPVCSLRLYLPPGLQSWRRLQRTVSLLGDLLVDVTAYHPVYGQQTICFSSLGSAPRYP